MEMSCICGTRSGVRHGRCARCRARDAAAAAAFGDGTDRATGNRPHPFDVKGELRGRSVSVRARVRA